MSKNIHKKGTRNTVFRYKESEINEFDKLNKRLDRIEKIIIGLQELIVENAYEEEK